MRFHSLFLLSFLVVGVFVSTSMTEVHAQTTSFNYQGRLQDAGVNANGSYDLRFTLWDALTGGTQQPQPLPVTVTKTSTAVSDGVFTVQLDFGAGAFPGANRWLETSIRLAGSGGFTTLAPRQPITSTPYAVRSLSAASVDSVPVNAVPPGSGNYIQNSTAPQASSNFNITGNGTVAGSLGGNIVNATTQYNLNGIRFISTNDGMSNTIMGLAAGVANSNGNANTFVGNSAGSKNTSGSLNAFIGVAAGQNNQTGTLNTMLGYLADVGSQNLSNATAIGSQAYVTQSNSLVLGSIAGINNATSSVNVGIGTTSPASKLDVAGDINTSTQFKISGNTVLSVGGSSNSLNSNIVAGVNAGASLTPDNTTLNGNYNSFFGNYAGNKTTTGGFNSFFGADVGKNNTNGFGNSFFGRYAGLVNDSGYGNTFVGEGAGNSNKDGSNNVFIGSRTLGSSNGNQILGDTNVSGSANTLIGYLADVGSRNLVNSTAIGTASLVTQSNSLVLGGIAGVNLSTADTNVGIGTTAPQSRLHVNGTGWFSGNNTPLPGAAGKGVGVGFSQGAGYVFGYDYGSGLGTPANLILNGPGGSVGIGTTSPARTLEVAGNIRVFSCVEDHNGNSLMGNCSSDIRFKRDIAPFPNLLDRVVKLQPVNYYWRATEFPEKRFGTQQSYGLIAQEVERVLPELVGEDKEGFKTVDYSKLPLMMLQAIKEQQTQIEQQHKQLKAQQQQIERERVQNNVQLRQINALKNLVCRSHRSATICK